MDILGDLLAAPDAKEAVISAVDRCTRTPPLLHSIAEGLRTSPLPARVQCGQIMAGVARERPDLLADFVVDLMDAARQKNGKIAKLAYQALIRVVPTQPSGIYAEREFWLETARGGGARGLAAAQLLAALCAHGANYRGKLMVPLVRLLLSVPIKDLPRWLATVSPAVQGSTEGAKRLRGELQPRLDELDPTARRKVDRLFLDIERPRPNRTGRPRR